MSTVKVSGTHGELSVDIEVDDGSEPLPDDVIAAAEQVAYSTLGELANKLVMLSEPSDAKVSAVAEQAFIIDRKHVAVTGRADFRSAEGIVHVAVSEAAFRVGTSVIMALKPVDVMRTMKLMGAASLQQPQMQQVPQVMPVQPVRPGDDFTGQYL